MEENATVIALSTIATKKALFGSSLLGSMVIFQDPAYILIACMGAFVSMGSAHYDFLKLKKAREAQGLKCEKTVWMELSKAFMVGSLFTLLSFMIFHQAGGEAMKSLTGLEWFDVMLPSFWLVLTVAFATEAVTIWDIVKGWIKGKATRQPK